MSSAARTVINIDNDWKFKKGMDIAGFRVKLNDLDWEKIHIPHDWSIFGPFKEENPSGPRGGYAPAGIAWYRKNLHFDQELHNKKIYIELDGVYMNSEVHLNGERIGKYPYGYTTLYYDITDFVIFGEDNLLAVKVDTSLQPSSRWYSGSGIYRHARIIITDKLHIGQWGSYVTTPVVNKDFSTVEIETTLNNEYIENKEITVKTSIMNQEGTVLQVSSLDYTINGLSSLPDYRELTPEELTHIGKSVNKPKIEEKVKQQLTIKNPNLWSTTSPYLYRVKTEIIENGKVIDENIVNTGIRTIEFDADKGFFLNGQNLKIKGVCLHHDGGSLGAACPDRANERQIEILKDMGCNAIRTSHNPPSPILLDLCDKHGMLVMDEVFDEYQKGKRPRVFDEANSLDKQIRRPIFAYAEYFDQYHEKDLTTMILRDRNHPSIILWSIGNEINEHMTQEGVVLTQELHNIVKKLDTTRPTVTGFVHLEAANKLGIPDIVDIAGYNYKERLYESEHKTYPKRKIMGSETSSAAPFEKRAVYSNFISSGELNSFSEITTAIGDMACQEASHRYCRAEQSWSITKNLDFISGLFLWTGFDYIGEPSPCAWPSKTSYFGVIDTCGFPKDAFYLYQSQWSNKTMLHLFPHWNWEGKEGQIIPVWCYTTCQSVELFLNGQSLGEKKLSDTELLHLQWHIPFEKGEIKAVGKIDGKTVMEKIITTSGKPEAIMLEADRTEITADQQDLAYITVSVVDDKGNIVPDATNKIEFSVDGYGKLIGLDNGDPECLEEYKGNVRSALGGKCLAILQSTLNSGSITLKAESKGLKPAIIKIVTK